MLNKKWFMGSKERKKKDEKAKPDETVVVFNNMRIEKRDFIMLNGVLLREGYDYRIYKGIK